MEPDNLLLDRYALSLSGKERPTVCFLPTASYDSVAYIDRFHASIGPLAGQTTHLTLHGGPTQDIAKTLNAADVIYVGGGNTMRMLDTWREWGVDGLLKQAYAAGKVLCGISAGSLCWFEEGLTDSIPGKLTRMQCLGLIKGSTCVHYDGEEDRRPEYQRAVSTGLLPGYGCDDGVALHYIDEGLHKIVSSRPEARAYHVTAASGISVEMIKEPDYLGGRAGTGTVIRRAVTADAEDIQRVHAESIRILARQDYSDEQIAAWTAADEDPETIAQLKLALKSDMIWVIELDGRLEGYMRMKFPSDIAPAAYLHSLYITPRAVGKKHGQHLMGMAEAEARERGFTGMKLHASKTAMNFYRKLGYEQAGPDLLHHVRGVSLECYPLMKLLI